MKLHPAKGRARGVKKRGQILRTGNVYLFTLCATLYGLCLSAEAQSNAPKLGYLSIGSPSFIPARVEAFRQGLRELGYIEGKNITIEWRYADGDLKRQIDESSGD